MPRFIGITLLATLLSSFAFASTLGPGTSGSEKCSAASLADREDGTVVAQTCAMPERCFDENGNWNGKCVCDACARQMGWCN